MMETLGYHGYAYIQGLDAYALELPYEVSFVYTIDTWHYHSATFENRFSSELGAKLAK